VLAPDAELEAALTVVHFDNPAAIQAQLLHVLQRRDAIAVRIDMVDRLARHIHERRDGRMPFMPDPNWAASLGLSQDGLARLLRALGYRPRLVDGAPHFAWAGRKRPPQPPPDAVPLARGNDASPFAVLAGMKGR
jgi:ATP-dependent RNA helicase SUPV3L1/SUV3